MKKRRLLPPERQVVDVVEVQDVPPVEVRRPPEKPVSLYVFTDNDVTLVAPVVLRLPKRVGESDLQAILVSSIRA